MQRFRHFCHVVSHWVLISVLALLMLPLSAVRVHAASLTATVAVDLLNVRRAPGLNYQVLGTLLRGAQITAVGRDSSATWIEAATPFGDGWLSTQFISLTNGTLADLPVTDQAIIPFATVSAFLGVLVHGGPSLDYPAIGVLFFGSTVTIIGHDDKSTWLEVQANNGTGWIESQYVNIVGNVSFAPNTASSAPATAKNVNYRLIVRSAPDANSAVIGVLSYNEYVRIVGVNARQTWWQVQGAFGTGWVSAQYVSAFGNLGALPVVG